MRQFRQNDVTVLTACGGDGLGASMISTALQRSASFTITSEDYANALRLHMRRSLYTNKFIRLFTAAVIAAAIVTIAISGLHTRAGVLAIGGMLGLCGYAVLLLVVYLFFLPLFLPRRARRIYGQQKTMQHPVEASWSDEAYSAYTAVASSTIPWLDYHGWSADESMILLMQSPVLFQMVPRHALSPEQAAGFIDHLERSGLRRI